MRRYEFNVQGAPPKKDGAKSMWNKPFERARIIALRRAAKESFAESRPLNSEIQLDLDFHWPRNEIAAVGDLDNFITGICDGLMAIARGTQVSDDWNVADLADIHPTKAIAIVDDRNVIQINARKIASDSAERWYRIVLVGS